MKTSRRMNKVFCILLALAMVIPSLFTGLGSTVSQAKGIDTAEELQEYLEENADAKYIPKQSHYVEAAQLLIRSTTYDKKMLQEAGIDSFDELYAANKASDELTFESQALLFLSDSYTGIYDLDKSNDYLVAFVDVSREGYEDKADAIDAALGYNNDEAEMVKGYHYDKKTGIVYIPKEAFFPEEGVVSEINSDTAPMRMQLMIPVSDKDLETETEVSINSSNGNVSSDAFIAEDISFNTTTEFKVKGIDKVDKDNINVYVNGMDEPLTNDSFVIDKDKIQLAVAPASAQSIEIEVKSSGIAQKVKDYFNPKATAKVAFDNWSYFRNSSNKKVVWPDSVTFQPKPRYTRKESNNSIIRNSDSKGTYAAMKGKINYGYYEGTYSNGGGKNVYSANYVSGTFGPATSTLWTDIVSGGTTNRSSVFSKLTPQSGLGKNNKTRDFILRDVSGSYSTSTASKKWASAVGELLNSCNIGLVCAHIKKAEPWKGASGGTSRVGIRCLFIDEARNYMIIGIATSTIGGQTGAACIKIGYKGIKPGMAYLQKRSAQPNVSDGNSCYDLSGAQYTVYTNEACTSTAKAWDTSSNKPGNSDAIFVTNAQGKSQTIALEDGDYWVKETRPATGFTLDPEVYFLHVDPGLTRPVNEEGMIYIPDDGAAPDTDYDPNAEDGEKPDTDMPDEEEAVDGGDEDEDPEPDPDAPGNDDPADPDNPGGGSDDDPSGDIPEEDDPNIDVNNGEVIDYLQFGNFELDKLDNETNLGKPQGSSTLTGHRYQVEFFPNANGTGNPQRTWVFATDEEGKIKYDNDHLVNDSNHSSDALFKNEKGNFAVPLGYVKVKEIEMKKDDEGYVYYLKDEQVYGGQIKANTGTNPSAIANTVHVTSKDQVPRADIEVHKQDEANKPLSVPFRITSQTTGESHEFMTNKSGDYSSSSDWRPHSQDTNGGTVQSGLWFNGYNDEETGAPVNDELGALPYDTYIVEELPCEANAKYDLDTEIIVVQEKGVAGKVTLNITNKEPNPGIKTSAKDKATNSHKAFVSKTTTIVDTVSYEELNTSKEYTIKGVLMSKETGEPLLVNGEEVRAESEPFVPETANGKIDIKFTFDSSALAGQSTVVFEELMANGDIIAEHKDIEDEGQTVEFVEPEIGTQAKDATTGTNNSSPSSEAQFIDTVMYKNLSTADTYKAVGVLYDKEAEETLKDEEGNEITAESEPFQPEDSDGEIEVVFNVDTTKLAGKEIVCFEKLYIIGKGGEEEESEPTETEIASHEDPEDGGQTLVITDLKLNTTARNKDGNKITSDTVTVVDTIDYKGFTPGQEYIFRGTLYDKKTKKSTGITASTTQKVDSESGSVEVEFSVDGKKWAGHELVCYEEASNKDNPKKVIASHKDITDKSQTVSIPHKPTPPVTKTGDKIAFIILGLLAALVATGAALFVTRKKKSLQ